MDNAFFDYISSSALSLVVSGNTGISPFLTLFVLGLVEMGNPELLNMGETMEVALASWWSIGILGLLTAGETVGKCIVSVLFFNLSCSSMSSTTIYYSFTIFRFSHTTFSLLLLLLLLFRLSFLLLQRLK